TFTTKRRFEVTSLWAASRSPLLAYSRARRCSSSTVRSGYLLISARYMASEPVLDGRADGCMVPPGLERLRLPSASGMPAGLRAVSPGLDALRDDVRRVDGKNFMPARSLDL